MRVLEELREIRSHPLYDIKENYESRIAGRKETDTQTDVMFRVQAILSQLPYPLKEKAKIVDWVMDAFFGIISK